MSVAEEVRRKSPISWVDDVEATASLVKVSEAGQRIRNCVTSVCERGKYTSCWHISVVCVNTGERRRWRAYLKKMGLSDGEGVD
jgi:hypothetical protein